MKSIVIYLGLILFSNIAAGGMPKYIYNEPPAKRFNPAEHPDLAYAPEKALRGQILSYKGQNRKTNRFCAIGLSWANGDVRIPVFWYTKKMMIRWDGGNPKGTEEFATKSMALSRFIDYEKDVVDTQEDVGLSPTLAVRSNVQELLRDCEKYRKTYVFKPFQEPKPCFDWEVCQSTPHFMLEITPKEIYDEPPTSRFKLKKGSYSSYPTRTALKTQILRYENQNKKTNHFCVMGLDINENPVIPIFWREKQRLIYWGGAENEDEAITSMAVSEGIPYNRNVVIEAQGNEQIVHKRSKMQKLLRDCEKYGEKFTIKPFEAPKSCPDWDKCKDKLGWKPEPIID